MQRRLTASNGDMHTLLFKDPEKLDPGFTPWTEAEPPRFVKHLRSEARSYDDLLSILTDGLTGRDRTLSAIASEDVAEALDEGWKLDAATVEAIRTCNMEAFGEGFDAGVVLAMARHLRDFTIEYTGKDGEDHADIYCMKEKDGPSTFSIHLGRDIWLLHDSKISIPNMPLTWQAAHQGRPLREIIDHPCVEPDDTAEGFARSGDYTEITGLSRRPVLSLEFTPRKAKHEGKAA